MWWRVQKNKFCILLLITSLPKRFYYVYDTHGLHTVEDPLGHSVGHPPVHIEPDQTITCLTLMTYK